MHILIAVLGAITALVWAFIRFGSAMRQGEETVQDLRGHMRRRKWKSKSASDSIDLISDPREAGAVLFYQIARHRGMVTAEEDIRLNAVMAETFAVGQSEAAELLAFARMIHGDMQDAANVLGKLARPINSACSDDEKRALLLGMDRLANASGAANDQQRHLIAQTKARLFAG